MGVKVIRIKVKSRKSGRKSNAKRGMQDTIIKSKFFEKIFDGEKE
jgi:hypothetical protein